jgi:holin-like protein
MFMLLFVLLYFGGPGSDLSALADGILRNLSLLFVPAAVGIIQQVGLLREHWIAVSVALVGSTLLTLLVTVAVFRGVARLLENRS